MWCFDIIENASGLIIRVLSNVNYKFNSKSKLKNGYFVAFISKPLKDSSKILTVSFFFIIIITDIGWNGIAGD